MMPVHGFAPSHNSGEVPQAPLACALAFNPLGVKGRHLYPDAYRKHSIQGSSKGQWLHYPWRC